MAHTLRRRFRLAVAPALVAVLLSAGPALASCAEPVPIEQALAEANTVFVGTVKELDYQDRVATFQVEETWKGDLPATVVVTGGPSIAELEEAGADGLNIVTSVDRTYEMGGRYLVVSHSAPAAVIDDNSCSQTQLYTIDLDTLRPAGAVIVSAADGGGVDGAVWAALGGAVVLIVAGGGWLVARNRRRRRDLVAVG